MKNGIFRKGVHFIQYNRNGGKNQIKAGYFGKITYYNKETLQRGVSGALTGRGTGDIMKAEIKNREGNKMYDKKLILYYSESGNTKKLAEMIQAAAGGELCPIGDAKLDLKAYDLIFIGTPNHSATMAKPVKAFVDAQDWTGCTVAPFCTHGMGGLQNVGTDFEAACKAAAKVFPTLPVKGVDVDQAGDKLAAWLKEILG